MRRFCLITRIWPDEIFGNDRSKIDATRLELIAKILQVSTEELLPESPSEAALREVSLGLDDLVHDPLVIRLLRAWDRIERSEHRDILLRLITSFDQIEAAPPKKMQPS